MKFNIPYKVRAIIYMATAVGSPIMAYLLSKGVIGELEVTFWLAEVAAVSAMAGLNVTKDFRELQ